MYVESCMILVVCLLNRDPSLYSMDYQVDMDLSMTVWPLTGCHCTCALINWLVLLQWGHSRGCSNLTSPTSSGRTSFPSTTFLNLWPGRTRPARMATSPTPRLSFGSTNNSSSSRPRRSWCSAWGRCQRGVRTATSAYRMKHLILWPAMLWKCPVVATHFTTSASPSGLAGAPLAWCANLICLHILTR